MTWIERIRAWGWLELGWQRPLMVGAVLRLIATLSGVGYLFADDYSSVMEPAYAWLDDPSAPFPWGIRSEFFPRLFSWCLMMADGLGISDPARMLQWAYGILGLWSLLAIVGTFRLTERFFDAQVATLAAWLMAAYPLMPRISTRALLEVACIPPLVWGLAFIARRATPRISDFWGALIGGMLIGIAAMFRFQVGLVYVGAFAVVAWQAFVAFRTPNAERTVAMRRVAGMFLGGAVAAGLQAIVDTASYGWPFASLYTYIKFNVERSTELYGRTGGFYTYALFFVLLALPPAAIAFAKPFWRAAKRAPLVSVSLLVFLVAHSFVPHKEERFMFSGLPMFFALLAPALLQAFERAGWSRRAVIFFGGACALSLPLVTLSDSQQSGTAPLLEVARSEAPPDRVYWVAHREPPTMYAGGQSPLVWTDQRDEQTDRRRPILKDAVKEQTVDRSARFIFARKPTDKSRALIAAEGYRCASDKEYPSDFLDDLVYRVNPKRNVRRSPTTVLDCERK